MWEGGGQDKVIWGCGGREPKHGGRLCVWKVGMEGGGGGVKVEGMGGEGMVV